MLSTFIHQNLTNSQSKTKSKNEDFHHFRSDCIGISCSLPSKWSRGFVQLQSDLLLQAAAVFSVHTRIGRIYGLRREGWRQGPVVWHHLPDHLHPDLSGIRKYLKKKFVLFLSGVVHKRRQGFCGITMWKVIKKCVMSFIDDPFLCEKNHGK